MKRSVGESAIGFGLVSILLLLAATTSVGQRSAPAPTPPGDAARKQEFDRKRALAVAGMTPHRPVVGELKSRFETVRRQALEQRAAALNGRNAQVRAQFSALVRRAGSGASPKSSVSIDPSALVPSPTPDPCASPKITQTSLGTSLEPGQEFIVNGCGFGLKSPQSDLRLVGTFPETPKGYLTLEVLEWHGYAIHARVPIVTGNSQTAKLQVVRKDLMVSNQIPIPFAPWEVVMLRPEDVSVNCFAQYSANECNLASTDPSSPWYGTVGIRHKTSDSEESDYDRISATLKSPWTFVGFAWWWWDPADRGYAHSPFGFVNGSSSLSMRAAWGSWTHGEIDRLFQLYAFGPVGRSYK
jgi:hypothetical protein